MTDKKIVSTLTVKLNSREAELLEKIKAETEQKVSTKALLSLLIYPDRYKEKAEENRKLKMQLSAMQEQIETLHKEHAQIIENKETEIQKLKGGVRNFVHCFDELRKMQ